MNLPTTNDFRSIVTKKIPLIDVRAPIEFSKGAFMSSINLPIMDDDDRHIIGTCYKEQGHDAAVELGYSRVSGDVRESRLQAWLKQIEAYPESMLYCFRGGSRSRITQEWITEATGKEILRLEGGYKAFRNYLIESLEPNVQTSTPIILGGYTGSGKTILLKELHNAVDLEGLANHRGSSFGNHITPQPTQITFENNLAYALINHHHAGHSHMVLEDEGVHIGSNYIPRPLFEYFSTGDLVVLERPLDERIAITLQEYVVEAQAEYIAGHESPEKGLEAWFSYISTSMGRLKKRLGGERFTAVMGALEAAYHEQLATGSYKPHEAWISVFLKDYYDPMYQYQLETTTKNIVFRGNPSDVLNYLQNL